MHKKVVKGKGKKVVKIKGKAFQTKKRGIILNK